MTSRRKFIILLIISGVFFIAFTAYSFNKEINRPRLPILSQVNFFTLVDQNSRVFDADHVKGKVWIAHFFFTTCSDVCPVTTKNMATLNRSFEQVKDIMLISISVNPENDNAEILKKFAAKFKASKNWFFLTGARDEITTLVVKSFKLGDIKEPVFHSTYLALVDRNGLVRGYYDAMDQEAINKLFADAAKLIKEKS
jgi:protein SCO1